MRAASTAALRALSTPTQATGTPGGIWAIESSASRPPATDCDEVSGTPMTGSARVGGDHARQRGRQARARDDHPQPAHLARSWRSRRRCRGRGGRTSPAPRGRCRASSSSSAAASMAAMSLLEPITMPTRGASTLQSLELRSVSTAGARRGVSRCSLMAAMSRRSCRPSNAIMSAAAYAAARAAGTSSPSAVTFSTRPPAVTIVAVALGGARVGDLDALRDRVEPADHVARGRGLG